MRHSADEIRNVLRAQGGVLARRDHPDLVSALDWMRSRGELVAVLPGVYVRTRDAADPLLRIRAAMLWAPDAVLVGATAAQVSFWPRIVAPRVALALPRHRRARPSGYVLTTRVIPAELVVTRGPLRYTCPALTALDLCASVGGDGIDNALRMRAATLDDMRGALASCADRPGNLLRRRLLLESRDEPWSAAERLAHLLLHEAGIEGWRANLAVASLGSVYYVDIAFRRERLAIEIDGRLHENDPGIFESDRWRQNQLALQGWTVLRFTWLMLKEYPDAVVETIREALNRLSCC